MVETRTPKYMGLSLGRETISAVTMGLSFNGQTNLKKISIMIMLQEIALIKSQPCMQSTDPGVLSV